jgi:hypothetical protein
MCCRKAEATEDGSGQVHRLPDSPEAYGAMITRPKAAPAQSRSAALSINLHMQLKQEPMLMLTLHSYGP